MAFEIKSRADFQKMVDSEIEETLTIEYKGSPALKRGDVDELCKDVSAMANSAGGQIIYGIEEDRKTHKPSKVDQGVTDPKITREWIHQVLSSNIQPRIDGISIQRIALSKEGYGYVISVSPTTTGPHQSKDKKYYKRFELQAVPMADYEIRDIMRRSTTPDLSIDFYFAGVNKRDTIRYNVPTEHHVPLGLSPIISNSSNEPSLYAVALIYVDARLTVLSDQYERLGFTNIDGVKVTPFRLTFFPNKAMPIFKEQPTLMPALGLIVPEDMMRQDNNYTLAYEIRSPGCHRKGSRVLIAEYGKFLTIYDSSESIPKPD